MLATCDCLQSAIDLQDTSRKHEADRHFLAVRHLKRDDDGDRENKLKDIGDDV